MAKQKKAAVLIYPDFSNYEMSIAAAIFKNFEKEIVVFSAEKIPVDSEEGFHFIPDKTFEEFDIKEYDCLILPGMWCFPNVIEDERYIDFLRQFKGNKDITIGSISSSPILLAKAGVLEGRKYCVGLFEEDIDEYSFLNRNDIIKAPLVTDGNIITAFGSAYREFAIAVAQKLGFDCKEDWFSGIKKPIRPEDYTFYRIAEK
ncbi:DJ-1/PfpI family protein [Clostridium oryzae]|uniref:Isonitrile hydratase n=1 Tax=Clostridium oryzae TaxID=1450648 RepID=A0A1V4IUV9_9CLOT|nr:DJ-1/PfpI family protein [Clostridium oryzae]OPJ63600.1 isonitrile hydratase [Clostridium oryzae]